MSSPTYSANSATPLDLSKWRKVPSVLIVLGVIGAVAGFFIDRQQFGFSWLLAYTFFLSLCLGGLGLTILHHLFDASWSVPIRRISEQLACLLPWMALLWIPLGLVASNLVCPSIYDWMVKVHNHAPDLSTKERFPLFTITGFYAVSVFCLVVWSVLALQLRKWSLRQDTAKTVAETVLCTRVLRRYAATGVFFFAITLTFAAILWVKALQDEWFSTMYGVYYFAGSMWVTIATVYVITRLLDLSGPLRGYVHAKTYYFLGSLLFAFTVFYAYITFAQYFIIWNANMPEETFWYVLREKGSWWYVGGIVLIFGHFFAPFLTLLRIDVKLKLQVMGPLCIWAWLMHFADMGFNIVPVHHPEDFYLSWMDLACMAFIGGLLAKIFVGQLFSSPIVPQNDPRFAESQDIYVASQAHDQNVETATKEGIAPKTGGAH